MSGRIFRSALFLTATVATVGAGVYAGRASATPVVVSQPTAGQQMLYSICYHLSSSDYVCPDSAARTRPAVPPYGSVDSTTVTTYGRDGRRSVTLRGTVDAVFLTKEATEKFLVSYYWATNTVKAQTLLRYTNPPQSR